MLIRAWLLAAVLFQGVQAPSQPRPGVRLGGPAIAETSGSLFENVVTVLGQRYADEAFRRTTLPGLAAKYRARAAEAFSIRDQRQVVHDLLSEVPASHLGLLSKPAFDAVIADPLGQAYPTVGFQLIGYQRGDDRGFYAGFVLEGGPAVRAGLLPGDVVRTIDGVPTAESPRLEWRSDDAFIGDERDPAVHMIRAEEGARISLGIERRPGQMVTVDVTAGGYSAMDAARASVRTIAHAGRSIGHVHFWYVHISGVPGLLQEAFEGTLRECDALVIDLRGRGGSYVEIAKILEILKADRSKRRRPIVALVDRQSRSGKDILAYELKQTGLARLVGEPSAGAVIPATFADVGHQTILMFPSRRLDRYTDILEFKPVEPDVRVDRAGPFAAGEDPILSAALDEALRLVRGGRP